MPVILTACGKMAIRVDALMGFPCGWF